MLEWTYDSIQIRVPILLGKRLRESCENKGLELPSSTAHGSMYLVISAALPILLTQPKEFSHCSLGFC